MAAGVVAETPQGSHRIGLAVAAGLSALKKSVLYSRCLLHVIQENGQRIK